MLAGFLHHHRGQLCGSLPQPHHQRAPGPAARLLRGKGYYGLHVHEAVLARGVKVTGATVHFVNEVCDGGPIILQKAVAVKEGDTPETLQRRVMEEAEWILLPQAVSLFCQGKLSVEDGVVHIAE